MRLIVEQQLRRLASENVQNRIQVLTAKAYNEVRVVFAYHEELDLQKQEATQTANVISRTTTRSL